MSKKFLIDQPTINDSLNFKAYRDVLIEIINSQQTPLTIGIFGQWGSGKTSLMRMVKEVLDDPNSPHFNTMWFNAWKYAKEDALWRAFILRVINATRPDTGSEDSNKQKIPDEQQHQMISELEYLEESLYHPVEWEEIGRLTFDFMKAFQTAAKGGIEIGLSFIPQLGLLSNIKNIVGKITGKEMATIEEIFHKERKKHRLEQLKSIEQFEETFSEIMDKYLLKNCRQLIVFIDDLDRCLPNKIIEIMESIKLFLDVKGCIFFIGCNLEIMEEALKSYYNDPKQARLYLEKIIQIPFILPPIETNQIKVFLDNLNLELPDPKCADVFINSLGQNPRETKRVINVFLLLWQIARHRVELREKISSVRLAKVVVIQHNHPNLYNLLRETPRFFRDLEDFFRVHESRDQKNRDELEPDKKLENIHPALKQFVERASLKRLFTLFPKELTEYNFLNLTPEELRCYIYLTYQTSPYYTPLQSKDTKYSVFSFEPQMIPIPSGEFQMGISEDEAKKTSESEGVNYDLLNKETPKHSVSLSSFEIGKYPVTNSEYALFINETNYSPPSHWEGNMYPQFLSDHPVVNVSWEDACAYCKWLSEKTGRKYRLPAEKEWEYAAKGNTENRYPWGNKWKSGRCNTREGGRGYTTPVGQYSPAGDSPFGCVDMAGNVYEWTDSWYKPYTGNNCRSPDFGEHFKVLRGGAYDHTKVKARCTFREWQDPIKYKSSIVGFRCIRESITGEK